MQYDHILLFGSLLKKLFFPGCSKMSLPSPKRLRAGRQMLVEPSEIPFAGAPEALRSEAYMEVRCNDEGPAPRQGKRRRWVFFSNC
jgi:hypothetical protein